MKLRTTLILFLLQLFLFLATASATPVQYFAKSPGENYPITFDYNGKLPSGLTVASGSCTASDKRTRLAAAVTTGGVATTPTAAQIRVTAGTAGADYVITMSVTLSDGSILIDQVEMQVRA